MTISTTRGALLGALSDVVHAATGKSSLDILDGVLVTPTETGIALRCTDLAIAATAEVACEHGGESFVVVAAMFRRVVDALPEGPITLSVADGRLTVKAGKTTSRLPVRSGADFPAVPAVPADAFRVKASVLRRVLVSTRHGVNAGDQSPTRDGLHLTAAGGRLTATATNGHVLARAWAECPKGANLDAFVPSAGVAAIVKALDRLGDGEVAIARDRLHMFVGGVSTRLYDEKPSPADHVLNASRGKHEIRLDRTEFVAAVKRAAITAGEHDKVRLVCAGESVTVRSEAATGETASELSAVAPSELEILCDTHYLLAQIEQVPDDELVIRLRSADGLAALVFESGNYTGLVMPMRV